MLIYEAGGFFLSHRDSEKYDRMLASLVVVLPNPFEEGSIIVKHESRYVELSFRDASEGKCSSYAAFFADCTHCVKQIKKGVRLSLTYNLLLRTTAKPLLSHSAAAEKTAQIAEAIATWVKRQPTNPLVFPLQHLYTQRGLALDLLKGSDRDLAALISEAANQSNCLVHFSIVVSMSFIWANYGIHENWYYRNENEDEGEEGWDDFRDYGYVGAAWTNENGRKQPWGQIAFSSKAVITPNGVANWTKASEEYEPYFGNHGNNLTRWYFQSAMVVWGRDHHQEIVGRSLGFGRIHLFCSMAQKLRKTPKKLLEQARTECTRLALAIMKYWPKGATGFNDWNPPRPEKSPLNEFPNALLALNDRELISKFLTMIAQTDDNLALSEFILNSCKKFGWTAFSSELRFLASGT